jgi:hypothetical protein
MDSRVRLALQTVGALVVVSAIAAALGFTYFALTFGSADHTQFTLTAGEMPRDYIAENATADLSGRQADLVAEAHHNGTARAVAETYDLNGTYVERNGTYYVVLADAGPTVTRERPVLTIERVNDTAGEVVTARDLPSADERAFMYAWKAWMVRNTDRGQVDRSVRYVYETVPDAADSVFVPDEEVQYVQRENRTFRVRIRNESVDLDTTEYRLEQVAANESAFADTLARNITGLLTESEAAPLDHAIENGTYVSRAGTFDDAARPIRPVAAALRFVAPSEFLYEEREQTRYVRYQGRYYRVTLTGYTTAA